MLLRALLGCCCAVALVAGTACARTSDGVNGEGLAVAGEYLSAADSTFPLVAGTVLRLNVTGDALSASAGCNTLGWTYRIDDDRLVATAGASTMIGCPEALADQDARLAAFLEGGPVVTTSADGFTLTGVDGTSLVLVDRSLADPDRALEGTRWVLDGITTADAAVSAVGFETVELVLNDGTVDIVTACSVGQAAYEIDGDAVVLGPLTLTPAPVGCEPGVREAETALGAVFGGRATVTLRADVLELRRGDVGLSLRER